MNYIKGRTTGAYQVEDVHQLDEFKATGILFRHVRSGCRVYHVHCPDPENLFAFGFKTIPQDSTGVAHILEHSVLCGSRSFPVKDPFLQLLKGSMNTFLNAFTFPDKTVYPASSTVEKDLFNLMEVYGDAVFHPLITPEMFRQEGHRLEFDADGKLVRTGIVYNEMKGNYSTHDSVAGDWCFRSLFPDTPYAHDSGGDPACIPDLTWEEFKAFHERFYHPSNALVFLYGNIDSDKYLDFLDRRFLKDFQAIAVDLPLPAPAAWTEPRSLVRTYPAGDDDDATVSVTVNWLLPAVRDPLLLLAHELLADILLGSAASPLQRALVDSGLGEDLSPVSGLETELSHLTFSAGLRGTQPEAAGQINQLILDTLATVVREGLNPDLVEGTLRRYEFRSREIKGGGPFGLRLMRRAMRGWLHGEAPQTTMVFEPVLKTLRAAMAADPRYLEGLVQRDYLDNPHRSTVTIIPDPEQNLREAREEEARVAAIRAAMGTAGEERVRHDQAVLERWQSTPDSPEALASIPFLAREDIPVQVPVIPAEDRVIVLGEVPVPVQVHDIYTNGICYVDLVFDLEHLDDQSLMYLPLFAGMVPSLGLPGVDYEEMARRINLHTGGFGSQVEAGLNVRSSPKEPEDLQLKLYFRLRCLESSLPEAMRIAGDLICRADFGDLKRLADLFLETRNEFRSSVVPSGSSYAAMRTERHLSSSEEQEERWRGITQLEFMEGLGEDAPQTAAVLSRAFAALRDNVVRAGGLMLNVTATGPAIAAVIQQVTAWARDLPHDAAPDSSSAASQAAASHVTGAHGATHAAHPAAAPAGAVEALVLPTKVSFVASSLRGSLMGSRHYSEEVLLAHLLKTGWLWERIRMKGGAYGANAGIDGMSGIFTFSSYRDPQVWGTLQAFRESLEHFARNPVADADLLLAKIGCVAREIRPMAPAEAGLVAFRRWLFGVGDELRQAKRDQLLAAGPKDLRQAAQRLLDGFGQNHSALISSPEIVDKEEKAHGEFRPVRHPVSV